MRVVITGGHGFLGSQLTDLILERGLVGADGTRQDVERVDLLDLVARSHKDQRVHSTICDLTDPAPLIELLSGEVSIFHLASMVSAESELDWSRAVATNVAGLINVLEAAMRCHRAPRLVFASSLAVFGGLGAESAVGDQTKQTPQSTYGTTKAIGELLVDDATRKGIVDGRSARLPTVIVRPGRPNEAASSFFSGMFREPLNGDPCSIPVGVETRAVVIGASTAVRALADLHDLDATLLGTDRAVGLPGLEVSVAEMIDVLREVGGESAAAKLNLAPDPEIESVVQSWPVRWLDTRGRSFGLPGDRSLRRIVDEYLVSRDAGG